VREINLAHGTMHLYDSAKSPYEQIIAENGNGFSSPAKGLFVGSVLGAAVVLLFLTRRRMGLPSDIPEEGVRYPRRYRPLTTTRVIDEEVGESGKPVKSSTGWRAIFYVASAVAMFADLRVKKR
jgi:hypothetical protein